MCIIHFVALELIMELSKVYLESLTDNKLKFIFEKEVKVINRGREIKFFERSLFHQVARFIFKMFRVIYLSFIFYFQKLKYYIIHNYIKDELLNHYINNL